jgi:hypothetical protein
MANKEYLVKHEVELPTGDMKYDTYTTAPMSVAEIAAYVAIFEGRVEVFEKNTELSCSDEQSSKVSGDYNVLEKIKLKHKNKRQFMSFPYEKKLILKESVSSDDVEDIFVSSQPFIALPDLKISHVEALVSGGTKVVSAL